VRLSVGALCSGPSRRGLAAPVQVEQAERRPALTASARGAFVRPQAGMKERRPARTKELFKEKESYR
jgi:hypothetical protein